MIGIAENLVFCNIVPKVRIVFIIITFEAIVSLGVDVRLYSCVCYLLGV